MISGLGLARAEPTGRPEVHGSRLRGTREDRIPRFTVGSEERMKIDLDEQLSKLFHQYGRPLLAIFVVVLVVHDVFGTHGYLAMRQKQQEIEKVNSDLQRLNKENSALEKDVQDLKADPQTIRKIAREELGLARPGETIIKLPAPSPQEPAAAKP